MIKKCGNCIHKDICEWGTDDPNKNVKCSNWQAVRYPGHWIKSKSGFKCSECGEEAAAQFSYCPDCGADMIYEVLT